MYRAIFLLSVLIPIHASAYPVISEILWAGSNVSTADEWLEIANPGNEDVDISGWVVTSLKSSGEHAVSVRFETGTVLLAGAFVIVASRSVENSRLLHPPFVQTSTMTLPNTKLLLRLLNANGDIVDEVDDGIGAPFAGANPTGGEGKASMERVDLFAPGTLKDNWRTATLSIGFDDGPSIYGTPGTAFTPPSDDPWNPPEETLPVLTCPNTEVLIAVQSGQLSGVGKTTVNFQAVASSGSLAGITCRWDYGDGFRSDSCNPPVHSFTEPGTFIVRLEALNQCGNTMIHEQIVEVMPAPGQAAPGNAGSGPAWYDGSRLVLRAALPNPEGADTGKEWVEIRNLEDRPVDLRGWHLGIGESSIKKHALSGVVPAGDWLRIYNSEIAFTLPNAASRLRLITPSDLVVSTIRWKTAEEGALMKTDDLRGIDMVGSVVSIIGPSTISVSVEGDARRMLGEDIVSVRLLGIREVVVDGTDHMKILRALTEGQRVELDFDTELWTSEGDLLAYVSDTAGLLQHRLLASGFWTSDPEMPFTRRSEFEGMQLQKSKKVSEDEETIPALKKDENIEHIFSGSALALSEVYPSPYPKSSAVPVHDWQREEWLEIANPNQFTVDLSEWYLLVDGKRKSLPSGLRAISGSLTIARLSLKNAGATLALVTPQGVSVSELTYPSLKHGQAYARTEGGFCLTVSATPGSENTCTAPVAAVRKTTAKAKGAVSPRVKKYAAAYKAQAQDRPGVELDSIVLQADSPASPVPIAILSFLLGMGCVGVCWVGLRYYAAIATRGAPPPTG